MSTTDLLAASRIRANPRFGYGDCFMAPPCYESET